MAMDTAYTEGCRQAEEDFGLRVAADGFRRPLPHGNPAIGAERLARTLTDLEPLHVAPKSERKSRLDRHVRWSNPASPYSTGASSYDYSGIGRDGAAL
jgi:hypothetical protein